MNKWTIDQQKAIENTGGTLLVSAAAGSGKTAVLVERIIRKVTVKNIPINKFLVLTFTSSAAAEMKEKIAKAIAKEVEKNPKNMFLRDQISLVHKAKITTAHSFCFDMIRENFTKLNIAPDFTVMDEVAASSLRQDCVNKALESRFESIKKDFKTLVNIVGENQIENEILSIYSFIQSNSNPNKYLDNVCENYENAVKNGFISTVWATEIFEYILYQLNKCENYSKKALEFLADNPDFEEKTGELLRTENKLILKSISNVKNKKWDALYEQLNNTKLATWPRFSKAINKEDASVLKSIREQYKSVFDELGQYVYKNEIEMKDECKKMHGSVRELCEIIKDFSKLYAEKKREKSYLDFGDAEHKSIELLMDKKTGRQTEIAREIASKFEEIMVDEYQDTNEIQDTLYNLLSQNGENIFMVGDIKQSIYRFREADPSIFSAKYLNFSPVEKQVDKMPRKVALSQNFRSRSEVLDSTNFIFENIMTFKTGGVDYKDDQKLYLGANYPQYEKSKAEFCLIDLDNIGDNRGRHEIEAEITASKIKKLVDEKYLVFDKDISKMRPANYSDIVILMRSKTHANTYKKALEKIGANVDYKEDVKELFGSPEIKSLMSLFKIIDNPFLDIEFVSAMRSQIFGFSDIEIAKIRCENTKKSVYENTLKSKEIKCVKMLETLDEIRGFSVSNSLYNTVWFALTKLDILAKYSVQDFGEIRRDNILRFVEFIASLDTKFGIYEMLNFISKMGDKNVKIPPGIKSGHAVKIMTMHASKGLEFPIVFIVNSVGKFNVKDLSASVICHNQLGIGMKYVDDENIVRYNSLVHKAISLATKDELTAEEMRVLYVAMTRPCEKLFVMCALKSAEKTVQKWCDGIDILDVKNYADWFGMNIMKLASAKVFYEKFNILENIKTDPNLPDYFDCEYIDCIEKNSSEIFAFKDKKNHEYVEFNYQYEQASKIASKLTATGIEDDEDFVRTHKKPRFVTDEKLTPAEKGIAHHIVMQFIDFNNAKADIKGELKRLFDEKFITKSQYECINPAKIMSFINSDLCINMQENGEIVREFKFSILVKASDYYNVEIDDKVLLQGVVDCMHITDDYITIIDYKTDYVTDATIDEISAKHLAQLEVYAKAMQEVYKKPVKQKCLYYFSQEKFVML